MTVQVGSVAIVFTCFNRKEKTISCLESLKHQKNMPVFDLYVCDDCSTDGTKQAILEIYPDANIVEGTGSLFWSRGMHHAMKKAAEKTYDYYLMINDDVEFFPTMWESVYTAIVDNRNSGVIGCVLSKQTGKQSYGGSNFISCKTGDYISPMIAPSKDEYISCDLANWNCFLISKQILEAVGIVDDRYEHAMGDFDYSFRMKKLNFNIVLAKEYVGYCENNGIENTFKDSKLVRAQRFKKLFAPTGLPIKSWGCFTKQYYKHGRMKNFIVPYIKNSLYILIGRDC